MGGRNVPSGRMAARRPRLSAGQATHRPYGLARTQHFRTTPAMRTPQARSGLAAAGPILLELPDELLLLAGLH